MSYIDDMTKWREEVQSIVGNNQAGWMMAGISNYLNQMADQFYFGEITYEGMQAVFSHGRNINLKANPYCQKVFKRWADQGLLEFTDNGIAIKMSEGSFNTPSNFIT